VVDRSERRASDCRLGTDQSRRLVAVDEVQPLPRHVEVRYDDVLELPVILKLVCLLHQGCIEFGQGQSKTGLLWILPLTEQRLDTLLALPLHVTHRPSALVGQEEGHGAPIGRVTTTLDEPSPFERRGLPGDRRGIEVQGMSQIFSTDRSQNFEHPQREIPGPVDAPVERSTPAKGLQVADELQQLKLNDPNGADRRLPVLHEIDPPFTAARYTIARYMHHTCI